MNDTNISELQSIIDKNSNAIRFAETNIESLKELLHLFPHNVSKEEIKQCKWIISRLAKEQRRLKCEIKGMIEDKRGYILVDDVWTRCKHKNLNSVTQTIPAGRRVLTYCTTCSTTISAITYSLPSEDHGAAFPTG